MILFFRNTRQNLINRPAAGQAGKRLRHYLTYALGEIALVMIGILLALQVNNWNEGKKTLAQEKRILNALHKEFEK